MIGLCLFFYKKMRAQLSLTDLSMATIDFESTVAGINEDAYTGAGIASSPASGQLDADGVTFSGIADLAGGTFASTDVPPIDAIFAVNDGPMSDTWLGVGPAGPWSVVLKINNDIMPATNIYNLEISIDALLYESGDAGSQTYVLEYALNAAGPWTQIGSPLSGSSPFPLTWFGIGAINFGTLCIGQVSSGSSLFLRLTATGTSNDRIAFNSLSITPVTTPSCNLTNITSFTTANIEDVSIDLNWNEDGSGDCTETYLVVAREGVAPAADLTVNNLQGLYDESNFTANSDWSARGESNEVFSQTFNTLGADGVDYVVYKGSGTSATITGLAENTNYNFLIMATGETCAWLVGDNINTTTLLPIELSSFTGRARERDILLEWTTQTELNNDYMVIERSRDGIDFREIGRIRGAGVSLRPRSYRFVDKAPGTGTNYYRLKQVDFNGMATYYQLIAVEFSGELRAWRLSPNLVSDRLVVRSGFAFEAGQVFQIIDVHGQVLRSAAAGIDDFEQVIEVGDLPPGAYFLRLNKGSGAGVKKFVKR